MRILQSRSGLKLVIVSFLFLFDASDAFDFPALVDFDSVFERLRSFVSTGSSSSSEKVEMKSSGGKTPKSSRKTKRQSPQIGDQSTLPYQVTSSSIPTMPDGQTINTRYMPTLGNGYLGFNVYSDAIYLQGLYNGAGSDSHRARIPNLLMTRVNLTSADFERRATRTYTMNVQDGYWSEYITSQFAYITHKMYVHQKYIRLFVVDINVKINTANLGGGTITMNYPQPTSNDINLNPALQYLGNWEITGKTMVAEKGTQVQPVYIFYMMPLTQISISGSNQEANYTMIMSIDTIEGNARQEFNDAQLILQRPAPSKGNWDLFMEHVGSWRRTWAGGRVETTGGNLLISKLAWFSQYYILSSLPAEFPNLPPPFSMPYYGIGRTTLGRGALGKDYEGHVMWDNEYYILSSILPFHPGLAKSQLRYRSTMMPAATANAASNGGQGLHYTWESAYSGADVSTDPCLKTDPLCNWRKIFITAGVNFGIRNYYSFTRDRDFMINPIYNGCDMSRDVAKFLATQAVYNQSVARYDLNGITGPDDFHPNRNDNAFTLAAASLAIHWARYFSCLCQRNERDEVPDQYIQIALYLNLPFNNVQRLHYEYQGFNADTDRPVKQADTVMLGFPLNWNYSVDIMHNDLNFYELLTDPNTPAMTWSWFTIGWKWTNEVNKMNSYFLQSYQNYLIQPFKVWTEYQERSAADQSVGNVNFLPGMGAFLQSLIYGFAGIRIRPDSLEVHNPMPPPGMSTITLYGFMYLGSNLTIAVTTTQTTVTAVSVNPLLPLILRPNVTGAAEESITTGSKIVIPSPSGFFMYTSVSETCEFPRDYIYMPWGYSPWINASTRTAQTLHLNNVLLLYFSLCLWFSS